MPSSESDEFSNGALDDSAFDESLDNIGINKREIPLANDRYDMALDVSASMDEEVASQQGSRGASRGGGRGARGSGGGKEKIIKNDKFDEALEVSASMQSTDYGAQSPPRTSSRGGGGGGGGGDAPAHRKAPSFGGSGGNGSSGGGDGGAKEVPVKNEQFDAAYDLSDDDASVATTKSAPRKRTLGGGGGSGGSGVHSGGGSGGSGGGQEHATAAAAGASATAAAAAAGARGGGGGLNESMASQASISETDEGSSSDGDHSPMANGSSVGGGGGDGSTAAAPPEGAYNPADYAHLSVAAEVRDLFQYIVRYKPHDVELETTLKCFVPDYIPTLGEMDAFLKVPRPDGKADDLGFKVLDEPSAQQSDAAVLELQLRAVTKRRHGDAAVRSIEGAHKAPQEVERWVTSIAELHRTKPPPQVHYKRSMPDVDKLMEVWPEEFEQLLSTAQLPGPELEMSLEEYAKTICAIMDIPVYENIIESLHLLFTVYQEFKNNAHFAGAAASGAAPSDAFLSSSYK